MKYIYSLIFLLTVSFCNAQIKFGQPIKETDYFLKYLLDGKSNTELEYLYNNGTIEEIIVHQNKQLVYDLNAVVNSKTRYISKDGKLNNILTQMYNLSVAYMKSEFDKRYSKHKVDDYYFLKDYTEYRVITEIDGLASIDYREVNTNLHPDLLSEIRKRKKLLIDSIPIKKKDTIQYPYDDSFSVELEHYDFYDEMIKNDTIYEAKMIENRKELIFAKPDITIKRWIMKYLDFETFNSNTQGVIKCLVEKDGNISKTEKLGYSEKLEAMMVKRLEKLSFQPAEYNDDTGITVPIRSYYYLVARIKTE